MNAEVILAQARVRQRLATERAEAALARLGREAGNEDPPLRSSSTAGLSAEELERDAASIRKILGVWRRIGKRGLSPVKLASGRWVIPKGSGRSSSPRETAIGRPLKGRRNS